MRTASHNVRVCAGCAAGLGVVSTHGFTTTSGVGFSVVTLGRNAMGNNSDFAIYVDAPTGSAKVYAFENVFDPRSGGARADGGGAVLVMSGNSGSQMSCDPSAHLYTYGSNAPDQIALPTCATKLGLL